MNILAIATFVVATIAGVSIWHTNRIRQKEFKLRLLDEIANWASSIQTSSLEIDIPISLKMPPKQFEKRLDLMTLVKEVIPFVGSTYIRAIASKAFERDLLSDIESTISNFSAYIFLKLISLGAKSEDAKEASACLLVGIEEAEKQLKEGEKNAGELQAEYSGKLEKSTMDILRKVGEIKAALLSSSF